MLSQSCAAFVRKPAMLFAVACIPLVNAAEYAAAAALPNIVLIFTDDKQQQAGLKVKRRGKFGSNLGFSGFWK